MFVSTMRALNSAQKRFYNFISGADTRQPDPEAAEVQVASGTEENKDG